MTDAIFDSNRPSGNPLARVCAALDGLADPGKLSTRERAIFDRIYRMDASSVRAFRLDNVLDALEGRLNTELLTPEEMRYFDALLGDAMDLVQTPAARDFWIQFRRVPNTDE